MFTLTAFVGVGHAQELAPASPLLINAWNLHCADDRQAAQDALNAMFDVPVNAGGLPGEVPSDEGEATTYAATMDAVLFSLLEVSDRFPELQRRVEEVALRWNYCDVVFEGEATDVVVKDGTVTTFPAAGPFPLEQQGFEAWGFQASDPPDRFVPELLSDSPLGERAFEQFFHRTFRQRCIPHPETGRQFRQGERVVVLRMEREREPDEPLGPYPFAWLSDCRVPTAVRFRSQKDEYVFEPPPLVERPSDLVMSNTPDRRALPALITEQPVADWRSLADRAGYQAPGGDLTGEQSTSESVGLENALTRNTAAVGLRDADATPATTGALSPEEIAKRQLPRPQGRPPWLSAQGAERIAKINENFIDAAFNQVANAPDVEKGEFVPTLAAVPTGGAVSAQATAAAAPLIANDDTKIGISGSIYHRIKLEGGHSTGITASYNPGSYFFIRGGLDYNQGNNPPLTYSWGIGYDDWHPGTFSAQINNWGPIDPKDGLSLRTAVLNLGYKIDSEFLRKYNIAGSLGFDIPFAHDAVPIFNTSWQWSPIESWFVRLGLQKKMTSREPWTYTYNFGRWDWRPFTLAATYDNFGPNEAFRETNFKLNGTVTVAYSYAF